MISACSRLSAVSGYFLILGSKNLSFSGFSTEEDQKITEEEAESAEIIF